MKESSHEASLVASISERPSRGRLSFSRPHDASCYGRLGDDARAVGERVDVFEKACPPNRRYIDLQFASDSYLRYVSSVRFKHDRKGPTRSSTCPVYDHSQTPNLEEFSIDIIYCGVGRWRKTRALLSHEAL